MAKTPNNQHKTFNMLKQPNGLADSPSQKQFNRTENLALDQSQHVDEMPDSGIEILYTKTDGATTSKNTRNYLSPASASPNKFRMSMLSSHKGLSITDTSFSKHPYKRKSQIYDSTQPKIYQHLQPPPNYSPVCKATDNICNLFQRKEMLQRISCTLLVLQG